MNMTGANYVFVAIFVSLTLLVIINTNFILLFPPVPSLPEQVLSLFLWSSSCCLCYIFCLSYIFPLPLFYFFINLNFSQSFSLWACLMIPTSFSSVLDITLSGCHLPLLPYTAHFSGMPQMFH